MSNQTPAAPSGTGRRGNLVNDPIRNFRFIVRFFPVVLGGRDAIPDFKPIGRFGFTSVSGFSFNVGVETIREGGYNATVHQVPTRVEFSAVQMDRGVPIGSSQNWDWIRMMLRVLQGTAERNKALFRSDVEVTVLGHPVPFASGSGGYSPSNQFFEQSWDDLAVLRFRLYNAWPTSVVYSDLNAGDNAIMVERMTLVHEGLDVSWAKANFNNGNVQPAPDFGNSVLGSPR